VENAVDNDDLLNLISNSLSSSDDTGPPVSEKLSKIINGKFQSDYSVEILQKYKLPENCEELFVPKIKWGKLNRVKL
jgi:hypothetical protein